MTERENILARVRGALKSPAPLPGSHGSAPVHPLPPPPVSGARQWLPAAGKNFKDWVELFAKNALDLKADFKLLDSPNEVRQALIRLRAAEGWKRAACHSGVLPDGLCPMMDIPLLRTDRPYDIHALEACDAGISECDALIAQTGSVLVTSRCAGGRALSVLPPHHVVLAQRDQLVPDLPAAFELLKNKYADNYPSMISFITGPSRTGDIERILVLGAHGPKKLTILCF